MFQEIVVSIYIYFCLFLFPYLLHFVSDLSSLRIEYLLKLLTLLFIVIIRRMCETDIFTNFRFSI